MSDLKVGQLVMWDRRPMVLLDRAPGADSWWLQDPVTGAVDRHWCSQGKFLSLVDDEYRGTPDMMKLHSGDEVVVRHRAGEWCVVRDVPAFGWGVYHAPSGRRLELRRHGSVLAPKRRSPVKLADAKAIANGLADRFPTFDADDREQVRKALELVQSWQGSGVAA